MWKEACETVFEEGTVEESPCSFTDGFERMV